MKTLRNMVCDLKYLSTQGKTKKKTKRSILLLMKKWIADTYGGYVFTDDMTQMICQVRGEGYYRSKGYSDSEILNIQGKIAQLIAYLPELVQYNKEAEELFNAI